MTITKLLCGASLCALSLSASANVIQNGSFEFGSFSNTSCNYMELSPGATDLDGWGIDSTVAWGLNTCDSFSGSVGAGFVDLSSFGASSTDGQISQTVSLDVGASYLFSIDNLGGEIIVSLDGQALNLTPAGSVGSYTTLTTTFVATSSTALLTVTNDAPGNTVVFVDNVQMIAAVPVPAALALFAPALCAFGLLRRRRPAQ